MIIFLAVVLAGIAGWLWTSPGDPAERLRRVRRLPSSVRPVEELPKAGAPSFSPPAGVICGPAGRRRPSRGEVMISATIGLMVFLMVGGVSGIVIGVVGFAVALMAVQRRESPRARRERDQVMVDLPLAADLMVACLRAGQPITGAVDVTVEAVGGPLGERLAWVSGQLRLGAAPESAWQALAAELPLAPLARMMSRAALSGAPVADVLTRLSDDSRHAVRAASAAAARRVGVQAVAPLGLCFLPAFVFLGIVPIVAGLAGEVLLP